MARTKPSSEPSASVRAQWRRTASPQTGAHHHPHQVAEANRSNCGTADMPGAWRESQRIDEFDAQNDWQTRIAAGLIKVR